MGWTWVGADQLLSLYPNLANSPVLQGNWPGFQATVDDMRAKGLLPATPSVPESNSGEPASGGSGEGQGSGGPTAAP